MTKKLLTPSKTLVNVERRLFMKTSLSLGALTLLTGCDLMGGDESIADRILHAMSKWNDKVQLAMFDPDKPAPTYTEADITDPFPFNGYYPEEQVTVVKEEDWKLELGGLVDNKKKWTLAELRALPQESQITRHICVEGWSAIGKWGGIRFSEFLKMVGADLRAPYVGFKCADGYFNSIDMATALHPQTIMALTFRDQPLPPKYGFPMKLRIPTKLGFKNPKHITAINVVNEYPGGYWENQGYNWFSGS
jgi:DMSO/TMAO reductase YedYZ molybdopterin-dependent catalytic subunit